MSTQRQILLSVVEQLERLGIPYMIVGSFASNYWGRPRFTHDADIVVEIPPERAAEVAQAFAEDFYAPDFAIEEAARHRSHFNIVHLEQPFKVDFWIRKEEPFAEESFRRRQRVPMFGREVCISSPEDTILSKLLWYRMSPVLGRQIQDAVEIYETQYPGLDEAYLDRWAAHLGLRDLLARVRSEAILSPQEE